MKAQDALANRAQANAEVAGAVSRAVEAVDPSLTCLAIAPERPARDRV